MKSIAGAVPRLYAVPLLLAGLLFATGCGGDENPPGDGAGGSPHTGTGGTGGEPFAGCVEDCAAIETSACEIAVCNDGSHPGEIGACVIVPLADGTACDDGLFCTSGDVCMAGVCQGTEPTDCGAEGDSCNVMACDEETDSCVATPVEDGTACDDGLFCTTDDVCTAGVCGGVPLDCGEGSACTNVTCSEDAQRCIEEPINEGGACDDGLFCTVNDRCERGVCVGGEPNDCGMDASSDCRAITCDEEAQSCTEVAAFEGQSCDNEDLCQIASTCQAGECVGVPKNCAGWDSPCTTGVCDPTTGRCEAEPGPAGVACGDGTGCATGVCAPDGNCHLNFAPEGSACSPSESCASGQCIQGSCVEDLSCKVALDEGFETCPEDWILLGDWQCGRPTSGPNVAYAGAQVLATNLSGNYSPNRTWGNAYAQTPILSLADYARPFLTFHAWIQTQSGNDGMNVKVSRDGGQSFELVTTAVPALSSTVSSQSAWSGSLQSWRQYRVDLSKWAGDHVVIRFDFHSNASSEFPGVYLDEVRVDDAGGLPLQIVDTKPTNGRAGHPFFFEPTRQGGGTQVKWSIVDGTNHHWLVLDPQTGAISGMPSAQEVGTVTVTLRVQDVTSGSNQAQRTFVFGVTEPHFVEGFENCSASGWVFLGDWQCGEPSSGPTSAWSGKNVIATNLSGNYSSSRGWGTSFAESPIYDLAGLRSPELFFRMWYQSEDGYDGVNLKISINGGPWQQVFQVTPPYNKTLASQSAWSGSSGSWIEVSTDLAHLQGSKVKFRLDFRSDGSGVQSGFYIDDFTIAH